MQTLQGTLLQPKSIGQCQVTAGAALRIGDDGRFAPGAEAAGAGDKVVGDAGCWILPGFVDAHLHVPHWDRRGIDGLQLFEWQEKIGFPAEARLAEPKAATALAEDFVSGVVAGGTTTVVAFGTPFPQEVDATFGVFARRGLRAIYGMTLNDYGVPRPLIQGTDEALNESRALAAKWHGAEGGRLRYVFSPRGSIRCSETLMRGAAELARMLKCHVQTHVAESPDEQAQVNQRFPEHFDEVDLFDEFGLLGPRTLLAHGVILDDHRRRFIGERGASLVHCPTANLFRQSGLMDYAASRAAGIKVALGSSIAGGFDPFMPRVAVDALQTAKAINAHSLPRRQGRAVLPAEAWWLLTTGGAAALGLEDEIGTLAPGYQADCLVVRPAKWIAELPPEQQVSALLYTLTPQQIEHVFIAGMRVGGCAG